ncbi:hypothetical protein CHGG_09130 [Chaetomium globosum CBS 148.51]|uniref:C2H2-type domain-containing protein n=1 Tax=Chaetomium globosum (strain ATCC 6205 / CBS 148.51 / DSM 1962 / NBRC 6347 / NRRL 1970) TaxID=306901 RepID=Q2GSC4_CHAGB|nr:uncharacterized protein CHGG_09130 [Chaetomium globosum CBS 148.51]EAQ85116.1 hypothetical protein CHGG_09130 [Chaetomium globosum CBS 148.51]
MATILGTGDLLAYNAKHRVLICRECQYAIQKSALGSHLLRHKVYRRERQRLLSAIAQLEILEPDDVQLPSASSLPVEGLPTISGYGCTAAGCGNLCASSKRMRRHWSEKHGESDPPPPFSRPVLLQTFFRGTRLRYFEVRSGPLQERTGAPLVPPAIEDGIESVASPTIADRPHTPVPRLPVQPGSGGLDLGTLRYFHHFTTITSSTLPSSENSLSTYWQVDVVAQALQLGWLMSGLLAISASHAGTLSEEGAIRQAHFVQAAQFSQDFFSGWEEAKRKSCSTPVEGTKAGAQMACILQCCQWSSEASATVSELTAAPFRLRLFINTIRGCSDPEFALRSAVGSEDMSGEEASGRGTADQGGGSNASTIAAGTGTVPPTLLQHIRSLPSRMLEPLGKPDSAFDFFATLSAIDTLAESCSSSYFSEDTRTVWMGMASWLWRVPAHFRQMVWRKCPAALVVLAHWSVLVERAESCYWFLKGSTANLRWQVAQELPDDDSIRGLVNGMPVVEETTTGA